MDYDIYYDVKHDGSYILHFPNNAGLDVKQVEIMFSQYGKVLSVNNRGSAKGLCFVRYKHLDEVVRCIDGFQTNELIKILPHKRKLKNTYTNAKAEVKRQNTSNKIPFLMNEQSNVQLTKGYDIVNKYNHHGQTFNNGNTSTTNIGISKESTDSKSEQWDKAKQQEHLQDGNSLNSISSIDNSSKGVIPTLKSDVVHAHEVIVANIHVSFGIYYILHLFEHYDPISISLMKVIPKTTIRYCHVYFKTSEDATAIEKEFDNYALCGYRLMVLRRTKLLEESLSS